MKFLHTADLHLGKTLYNTPLFREQQQMLDNILTILQHDEYAALLIAGDIYDRAVPPVQSVSMFGKFLAQINTVSPNTAVCIISGNHDSSSRLAFANEILQHQNIHIHCQFDDITKPLTITHNGECADIFFLPFLYPNAFSHAAAESDLSRQKKNAFHSQADMAAHASKLLQAAVSDQRPSVLMAHLFTIGGTPSESERIFIGTAEYINPHLFSFFSYTALGHLHKPQKITDRMYYSGSPLAYSFDEAGQKKHVLSVEIDCTDPEFPCTITPIPITPLTALYQLQGTFEDFLIGSQFDKYANSFLEIILTDAVIRESPAQLLHTKFPNLLHVRQSFSEVAHTQGVHASQNITQRLDTEKTLLEQFFEFQHEIGNDSISNEKEQLFLALLKDVEHEA